MHSSDWNMLLDMQQTVVVTYTHVCWQTRSPTHWQATENGGLVKEWGLYMHIAAHYNLLVFCKYANVSNKTSLQSFPNTDIYTSLLVFNVQKFWRTLMTWSVCICATLFDIDSCIWSYENDLDVKYLIKERAHNVFWHFAWSALTQQP